MHCQCVHVRLFTFPLVWNFWHNKNITLKRGRASLPLSHSLPWVIENVFTPFTPFKWWFVAFILVLCDRVRILWGHTVGVYNNFFREHSANWENVRLMTVTLWHYDRHIMTVTLWPSHYDCHIMTMKFLMKTYYFPRTNYDNMSGNCFFWIFITKLH